MSLNTVLSIGELLIDFIGDAMDTSLSSQSSFMMKAGGAPANVACVIGALGGQSIFFGAVGNDGFGDFLADTLKAYHVGIENLNRSEKATTLAFVSVGQNGERDFVFVRGADADLSLSGLNANDYNKSSIIHFGAATGFLEGALNETYHQLLGKGLNDHKCISFDPNYRSAFWQNKQHAFINATKLYLKKAHLIKLSDEEALILSGESELQQAIEYFKARYEGTFAITLGERGVTLFNRNWSIQVPAKKVDVKDTTGAGDAFVGALLRSLSAHVNPKDALNDRDLMARYAEYANQIAASICTEYGALTALKLLGNY